MLFRRLELSWSFLHSQISQDVRPSVLLSICALWWLNLRYMLRTQSRIWIRLIVLSSLVSKLLLVNLDVLVFLFWKICELVVQCSYWEAGIEKCWMSICAEMHLVAVWGLWCCIKYMENMVSVGIIPLFRCQGRTQIWVCTAYFIWKEVYEWKLLNSVTW